MEKRPEKTVFPIGAIPLSLHSYGLKGQRSAGPGLIAAYINGLIAMGRGQDLGAG